MSQQSPSSPQTPSSDPWRAFGYLVAGVGFYGVLGWLLDRWLGTTFLVAVGIVMGAGLGMYLSIKRFSVAGGDGHGNRADED